MPRHSQCSAEPRGTTTLTELLPRQSFNQASLPTVNRQTFSSRHRNTGQGIGSFSVKDRESHYNHRRCGIMEENGLLGVLHCGWRSCDQTSRHRHVSLKTMIILVTCCPTCPDLPPLIFTNSLFIGTEPRYTAKIVISMPKSID